MLKEKFLRRLLVTIGSLYLIFLFIYKIFSVEDPMNFYFRVLIFIFCFLIYFLSYRVKWIYINLGIICHSLVVFTIIQVLYYSYLFDFKLKISGLIFLTIVLMNLIFRANKLNFLINIFIGILLGGSLWLKNKSSMSILIFIFAYISISFSTLYLKKYLQDSKEKLENLANQAPGTLYQYQLMPDGNSKFPYASQGIYKIYEVTPEEIKNDASKVFKRIHPDDYLKVVESIQKSADTLETWHDEYRVILPLQGKKWVHGKAKPEKLPDGSIIWHGNIREITKEKEMQIEIVKQKDRLNWIIEGMGAGTWEWNILTGETVFNKQWAEMLGYSLDDISPMTIETWKKYTHPDDLENAQKNLEKHFRGEVEKYDVEIRMKHKEGHWVWINDRGQVISWTKDNKPYKMFGIHLDVTKRKEREEKLEFLAASMGNISDAVMITDTHFKIVYINDAAKRLFGYSYKEIEGKTPEIFNAEENSSEIQQKIYDAVSNDNIYKTEFINKRKDGSTFICEMTSTPLKNEKNEIYAHIGIQRDITERKKHQKILKNQFDFQKILADVSSSLLKFNSTTMDRKIDKALAKIGIFFDFDRSYIFQLSIDNQFISNTHEWCAIEIESEKENLQMIPIEMIPWWISKLYKNQVINIPSVDEMKKRASVEQQMLKEQKVQSAVVIPIFIDNELFGFFGFDSVITKRIISDKELESLKIFTDLVTSAFSKYIYDEKIIKLTYNDSLTGLYNRRFFENELMRLDTNRQLPISIIIADINGLKIINDSLGHEKGDQLLIKSANILKSIIRQEDILARQGGDEFAILLPQTDSKVAEIIIKRIKECEKKTETDELTVSIALGTSTKTVIDQDIHEVLKVADNHMYQNKLLESKSVKNNIIKSLLKTLEIKSNETNLHTIRMTKLATAFGKALELSNYELNRLSLLSTLHDIGKTMIPEEILMKPGELTKKEWEIVKKHPESGYKIANSSQEFAVVADAIYAHHERWLGNGYPRKLKGKEIPYLARIITIVDAYDVMTHERPYKKAFSRIQALEEIRNCAGKQFDPTLARIFIKMMKEKFDS